MEPSRDSVLPYAVTSGCTTKSGRHHIPVMGQFKEKRWHCAHCGAENTRREKETDVNIGLHLLQDAHAEHFDPALLISNDSNG